MTLSPGEIALLDGEINPRMMLALAEDDATRQAVMDTWRARDAYLAERQRDERAARVIDEGPELFFERTDHLMRQRSGVPL